MAEGNEGRTNRFGLPRLFASGRVRRMISYLMLLAHALGLVSSVHAIMATRTLWPTVKLS